MTNTLLNFSLACAPSPPPSSSPTPTTVPLKSKQRCCFDGDAGAEAVWAGEEGHRLEHQDRMCTIHHRPHHTPRRRHQAPHCSLPQGALHPYRSSANAYQLMFLLCGMLVVGVCLV